MTNHIYEIIELVGSSEISSDAAIHNAIEQAEKSHGKPAWFEVVQIRGYIEGNKIKHHQVHVKIGFHPKA